MKLPASNPFKTFHLSLYSFGGSLFLTCFLLSVPLNRYLLAQYSSHEPSLSGLLPKQCDSYLAFQSSLKIEQAIQQSCVGEQLRSTNWQSISRMQIKDGVGSLLNPQPWFGFRWENLSGTDAKGLLFSANVGKLDIQAISAFQFEDISDARRFISSWRENDRKEPDSKSPRTPIPGRNNEALWYTNQSTRCHLLQIDKLILVSTSEIHLKEWLQDAIARGVWTSKTDTAADVELKAFEQSNHTGVRFWLRPQQFANHWSKSMRPSATAWTKATLPSLQSVAGTLFVPNDEGAWTVEYHVQLQKNLQSVAKLLSFTSDKPIEIPGLDFTQAETWTMSNVDIKDWFEGFCQSMNIAIDPKIPGMFDDIIDAILTDPEGPKVDLKKDLFHRLKPSIAVVSKSTFEPIGTRNRDYIWLFELDSGVDAVKLADKLFEEDDIVEKESVGDYSVWFTRGDAPLLTSATTGSGRQIQSLACGPKYLIACSNKDWLTEALIKSTPEHTPFFSLSPSWSKRLEPQAREPRSLLQGIDGKKAFRIDWEHVQNAERQTLMATAFLDLVLGGTSYAHKTKDLVPNWTSVHNCFGILSHSLIKTSDTLNGSIVVDGSN